MKARYIACIVCVLVLLCLSGCVDGAAGDESGTEASKTAFTEPPSAMNVEIPVLAEELEAEIKDAYIEYCRQKYNWEDTNKIDKNDIYIYYYGSYHGVEAVMIGGLTVEGAAITHVNIHGYDFISGSTNSISFYEVKSKKIFSYNEIVFTEEDTALLYARYRAANPHFYKGEDG